MPYTKSNLPDAAKKLPAHGQDIFLAAFSSAMGQYKDEPKAFATAWAAVEKAYEKDANGKWRAKPAKESADSGERYEGRTQVKETLGCHVVIEAGEPAPGTSDVPFTFLAIRIGETRDKRREYTPSCLREAAASGMYDHLKLNYNHEDDNDKARGHRDVLDWCATTLEEGAAQFVETLPDGKPGGLVLRAMAHHDALRGWLQSPTARAALEFSHHSSVRYRSEKRNGRPYQVVEAITRAHSVDVVPYGNAGGRLLESAREDDDMDREDIAAVVTEANKPIVEAIARLTEALTPKEEPKAEEPASKPPTETVTEAVSLAEVDKRVREAVTESRRQWDATQAEKDCVRDTREAVREALTDATDLPPAARTRIAQCFDGQAIPADSRDTRIAEAISGERNYLRSVGVGGPHVRDAGTKPGGSKPATYEDAMREAMLSHGDRLGLNERDLVALGYAGKAGD